MTTEFHGIAWAAPAAVAIVAILLLSLMREPGRQRLMALMVAGAGAAYLSGGGAGLWEPAFCVVMVVCAYRGMESYRWLGAGWLLHTGWDIFHHLTGHPILPFDPTSALGCAICDPVLAVWCFAGGPSLYALARAARST